MFSWKPSDFNVVAQLESRKEIAKRDTNHVHVTDVREKYSYRQHITT